MLQLVNDRIPTGNELGSSFAQPVGKVVYESAVMQQLLGEERRPQGEDRPYISRFSIYATVPPATEPYTGAALAERLSILQRADDVSAILRMLSEPHTNAVILSGEPGAGKSTLAALVYHHLRNIQDAHEADKSAMGTINRPLREDMQGNVRGGIRYFVWLSLGPNATLADVIAAILGGINRSSDDFFLLTPEQQLSLLVQALGRPQENAFIVLDQFEELLNPARAGEADTSAVGTKEADTSAMGTINRPLRPEGLPGRGPCALFFERLRDADIGASRLLLTSYRSPNGVQNGADARIRSYLVSRISIPEGVALLQQCGVHGSHSELSLVWQRCGGHISALILFSILTRLSGFSLSYLLNSPDYAQMWNGEVTQNLIGIMYYYLNPMQRTLMRALCLFAEPVPLDAIATAIMGDHAASDGYGGAKEADTSAVGGIGTIHRPLRGGQNGSPYVAFHHELSALVEMSLVQEQSRGIGQHTYFLHSLLRHSTVEHYLEGNDRRSSGDLSIALGVAAPPDSMVSNPEARQIALAAGHMRVAAYYAHQAQEFCPPRKERTGLADVEPVLAMIRHLCLGWHWQEAYNLLRAEGLHEDMLRWGALSTLIGLYTAMLPPLGVLSRHDFGEVCSQSGMLYARLGDATQSRAYYEQALAVFREVGDGYTEAVTLANEGELFRGMGDWEKARSNFEQALVLSQRYADASVQSVVLHNLGLLYQAKKDYTRALRCYVESLKIAHRLPERYNEGMILSNMGFLLYEQAHLPEAIALLSYAVQVRQSLHDPAVSAVLDFLHALEQKMGSEAFARLRSAAAGYNLGMHDLITQLLSSSAI